MWRLIISGILALGVAAATVPLFLREAAAWKLLRQSQSESFLALRDGAVPRTLSVRTLRGLLAACDKAILGSSGALQPDAAKTIVSTTCAEIQMGARGVAPDWGLVAYSEAVLLMREGSIAAAEAALERSRRAAPFEGWLAARRLRIALELGGGGGTAPAPLDHDLSVLMAGDAGRSELGKLFRKRADLRPRITTLVSAADPDIGAKALAAIRMAADQ